MLRGKGPHKPEFAYDLVCIHSLGINTDTIDYKFVDDTKAYLVRRFISVLEPKAGDIATTGLYMKNQTFSNLHFRPVLKIFFQSIHID